MTSIEEKYLSIKDFANRYQSFSESGLRWLIFTNPDFENTAVRRMGRRVLLKVEAVWNFIEKNNGGKSGIGK